jgi:ADP-heptose:LPS heptosyltransferase
VAEVRARRFDLVVDLFGNPRSALLTACSGARYRLGYDVRGRRHAYNLRQPRHVLANGTPRLRYATEVNLDMARRLGADLADSRAELVVSDAEKRGARERLAGLGIGPDEHTVAILPSGSWPAKTWPEDRFARMADLIARRPRTRVVLLWGPGEEGIARRVAARMTESAEVAPPLGLRELMAFLQTVTLFVGNDSGPKHLAAAVGTPVVALYGPTRAATWHPPGTAHVAVSVPVPCGPCDRTLCPDLRCLLAITPEHVAREVIVRLP